MHRHTIVLGLALILIASVSVYAQNPTVAIYFDDALEDKTAVCPSTTPVFDTLYIVAESFPNPVQGIEYKIVIPPGFIIYLDEITVAGGFAIGESQIGVSIVWPSPQDYTSKGVVQMVRFIWDCDDCESLGNDIPIEVLPNTCSYGSYLRAVSPSLVVTSADGEPGYFCPTVTGVADPTPPDSWGRIKALYDD